MVSRSHLTCLCDSPVWSVLGVGQPEDVEKLVGAPDVVHPAPTLAHWTQHQHMSSRTLQESWLQVQVEITR